LVIIVTVSIPTSTSSIEQTNNDNKELRVKAAYIYNFTKFVYWDTEESDAAMNQLTISVIGADPIFNILEDYAKKQTQGRIIKVKKISKEISDISDCQLLFISNTEPQNLYTVLKQLEGSKTLTISDISGFSRRGGMIGFFIEDGRVKIEVNLNMIKKAGLKISAKLLEVARIVSDED
jgi:hypothetical protein